MLSKNLFLEWAAYYQFAKHFEEKGVTPDIKDANQTEAFLHDFYPGMKDMPNLFAEFLASQHPEKTLNIKYAGVYLLGCRPKIKIILGLLFRSGLAKMLKLVVKTPKILSPAFCLLGLDEFRKKNAW